jgi:hypothetical protein
MHRLVFTHFHEHMHICTRHRSYIFPFKTNTTQLRPVAFCVYAHAGSTLSCLQCTVTCAHHYTTILGNMIVVATWVGRVYAHAHTHICTCMHAYGQTYTCIWRHIRTHVRTSCRLKQLQLEPLHTLPRYVHAHTRTHIHTHRAGCSNDSPNLTPKHSYIHTHTNTHRAGCSNDSPNLTPIHTYIHTHKHTSRRL